MLPYWTDATLCPAALVEVDRVVIGFRDPNPMGKAWRYYCNMMVLIFRSWWLPPAIHSQQAYEDLLLLNFRKRITMPTVVS